jgi:hypothetical protein
MSEHDNDDRKIIDCSHLFEKIRDENVVMDSIDVEARQKTVDIQLKTARLADENATLKLKDRVRVPAFFILASWSVYAVCVNWAVLNWIDVTYSVSFALVAVYMTFDAIWWQREFRHLRLALNEAAAILAKNSPPSDL